MARTMLALSSLKMAMPSPFLVGHTAAQVFTLRFFNLPGKRLQSASEVVELLGETINQVRRGELEPRVSNAIGYLAGILLSAIEKSFYEERLSALEAAVATKSHATTVPFDVNTRPPMQW